MASSRWEKYCSEVNQLDSLQFHSPYLYRCSWMSRVQVTNHVMFDEKQKIFLMFFPQDSAQFTVTNTGFAADILFPQTLLCSTSPSFDTSIFAIRSIQKSASKPDDICFRPSMETCPGLTRAQSKQAEQTGLLYVGSIRGPGTEGGSELKTAGTPLCLCLLLKVTLRDMTTSPPDALAHYWQRLTWFCGAA